MKHEDTHQYKSRTKIELSNMHIDHDLILCGDQHCHIKNAIDQMYKGISDSLLDAGDTLPSNVKHNYSQVNGWNSNCREQHTLDSDAYLIWRANGKKRQGVLFDSMKQTWAQLNLVRRNCRQEEAQISVDLLANKLIEKNDCALWKEVQKVNNSQTPLASSVGNVTGGQAITEINVQLF